MTPAAEPRGGRELREIDAVSMRWRIRLGAS
jgi:hypothetical protein